jgi:hypothetical protein
MNVSESAMAEQVAKVAIAHQTSRTGHVSTSVDVVLTKDRSAHTSKKMQTVLRADETFYL